MLEPASLDGRRAFLWGYANRNCILFGGDLTVAGFNQSNLTATAYKTALNLTKRSGLALEASVPCFASSGRQSIPIAPDGVAASPARGFMNADNSKSHRFSGAKILQVQLVYLVRD